jgi:hypothetical protein
MMKRWSKSSFIGIVTTALAACAPGPDSSDGAVEEASAPPRFAGSSDGAAVAEAPAPLFDGSLPGVCPDLEDMRVYVIVIDSLDPAEIRLTTPHLRKLKVGGTSYENARAVLPSSTTPNHAAMMTGVAPQRSGIIDNIILGPNGETLAQTSPAMFEQDHLFTRIESERSCIQTASILSVKAISDLFRDAGRARRAGRP